MLLASAWVTHLTNESAWDEMNDLVADDPMGAWRIIRALIGAAPDYSVLAAVAAGPIEDLIDEHGDSILAIISEEALINRRLRICLRAAYSDLPTELRTLVESEITDVRDIPPDEDTLLEGKDLALVVSWLHHSDTSWSFQLFTEMIESDSAAAWDVLRVLAIFADDDTRIQDDIFEIAFRPFMRSHFVEYRDRLVEIGRRVPSFRQWVASRKRPLFKDAQKWATFLKELASV